MRSILLCVAFATISLFSVSLSAQSFNEPFCPELEGKETVSQDYTYGTNTYRYTYLKEPKKVVFFEFLREGKTVAFRDYCYDDLYTLKGRRYFTVGEDQYGSPNYTLRTSDYYHSDKLKEYYGKIAYRSVYDADGKNTYAYEYDYADSGSLSSYVRWKAAPDYYQPGPAGPGVSGPEGLVRDIRIWYGIDASRGDYRKIVYREYFDSTGQIHKGYSYEYSEEGYLEKEEHYQVSMNQDPGALNDPYAQPNLILRKQRYFGTQRASADFRKEIYVKIFDAYEVPQRAVTYTYEFARNGDGEETSRTVRSMIASYRFVPNDQYVSHGYQSYDPQYSAYKEQISTVQYRGTYLESGDYNKPIFYIRFDSYGVPLVSYETFYSQSGIIEKRHTHRFKPADVSYYYGGGYPPYGYNPLPFYFEFLDDKVFLVYENARYERYLSREALYNTYEGAPGYRRIAESITYDEYATPQSSIEYIWNEDNSYGGYRRYRYEYIFDPVNPAGRYEKILVQEVLR